MQRLTFVITFLFACVVTLEATARPQTYGQKICKQSEYSCHKVKRGESWYSLFKNEEARDIVRRVNRMNIRLRPGRVIAIPRNLENLTIYDVAPFPRYIDKPGEKVLYISQKHLAWGAYDSEGELMWWGPISSGKNFCSDTGSSCSTPGGTFRVIRKQGRDCISTAFPRRSSGINGGAPMPFCMHFFRGYALHGSYTVPGHRDSHGCVRLFIEDAKWLNKEFIDLPGRGRKGTQVIIEGVS